MSDFLTAIGLVLAIEGTLYAAFPDAAKRLMEFALSVDDSMLRRAGLTALCAGIAIVWLVRG